jgi:hypothetical protein
MPGRSARGYVAKGHVARAVRALARMADPHGRSKLPPLPSLQEPLYVIPPRPDPIRKKAAALPKCPACVAAAVSVGSDWAPRGICPSASPLGVYRGPWIIVG